MKRAIGRMMAKAAPVFCGLLAGILAIELISRIFIKDYGSLYQSDPYTHIIHRANIVHRIDTSEFHALIKILALSSPYS